MFVLQLKGKPYFLDSGATDGCMTVFLNDFFYSLNGGYAVFDLPMRTCWISDCIEDGFGKEMRKALTGDADITHGLDFTIKRLIVLDF